MSDTMVCQAPRGVAASLEAYDERAVAEARLSDGALVVRFERGGNAPRRAAAKASEEEVS